MNTTSSPDPNDTGDTGDQATRDQGTRDRKERAEQIATSRDPGLLRELATFLREEKKWWLVPLVASLLLVGLLAAVAGSPAGPFIYTLF